MPCKVKLYVLKIICRVYYEIIDSVNIADIIYLKEINFSIPRKSNIHNLTRGLIINNEYFMEI
jgi:hypothetical protein